MRKMVFITFFYAFPLLANPHTLDLHLDCAGESANCVEVESEEGKLNIRKDASLSLSSDDLSRVEKTIEANGSLLLQLTLKETAAAKMLELTRNNVGKPLHILTGSQHVVSPTIKEEVSTQLVISFHPSPEISEKISWLEKLADKTAHQKETNHGLKILIMGIFAVLCVLGVVFLKKKVKFKNRPTL